MSDIPSQENIDEILRGMSLDELLASEGGELPGEESDGGAADGGSETDAPAAEPDKKPEKEKKPREPFNARSEAYDWLQCIVSAILVCVIAFTFFTRVISVIGTSMVPTLHEDDKVVISNVLYTPKQGDIVILCKKSFMEKPIVKRVIAVGGQTIDIDFDTGAVYVDGEQLQEDYIAELTHVREDFVGPKTVPEGCVFVMGDNRNGSKDSRTATLDCVDERYILGKVLIRILPLSGFGAP